MHELEGHFHQTLWQGRGRCRNCTEHSAAAWHSPYTGRRVGRAGDQAPEQGILVPIRPVKSRPKTHVVLPLEVMVTLKSQENTRKIAKNAES
jgi:hypothetical protein